MTLEIHYRNNIIIEFELPESVRLDQLKFIAIAKSKMSIKPGPEKEYIKSEQEPEKNKPEKKSFFYNPRKPPKEKVKFERVKGVYSNKKF